MGKKNARPHKTSKKHATRKKDHANPRGVFEANPRGFGFVKTPEGDFFIPESKAGNALDGDLVEIAPMTSGGRKNIRNIDHGKYGATRAASAAKRDEAKIVRVLERKHETIIGRYEVAGPFGVVVPDDPRIKHDIFTLRSQNPDIEDGSYVRVRIVEYPTRKSSATGVIEEVLGHAGDEKLSMERIIARHNLETEFSAEACAEAAAARLEVETALGNGYRDIRDRFIFTIDPDDAKDFDDALSIKQLDDGTYRLGVHIADVSAYVGWATSLDLDARKRATSVYLADRVIPMLPPELSENLCSLRPGEERLCMTCDVHLDAKAQVIDYDLYPAVMRSTIRLTYGEALSLLQGADASDDLQKKLSALEIGDGALPLQEALTICSSLAKARTKKREGLGGIEFSTREARIMLDEEGHPTGIAVREKDDATTLIEEAMILANEIVATHLENHDAPCAYRVHEAPARDALANLLPTLQEFSWFSKEDGRSLLTGNPFAIQKILKACEGRTEQELVTMLMLRAMMRALYSPENSGHYGLGLKSYCHFTSPIRRYPDLIVHRMLKAQLGFAQPALKSQIAQLGWLCEHASEMERVAEAASFDSQKVKMAEYMAPFVGQEFDAMISGVMSYGLYVRLDDCIEGLVPVRTLGDEYFVYDEDRHILKGSETNTTYRLAERMRVRLTEVDQALARLDFVIVA